MDSKCSWTGRVTQPIVQALPGLWIANHRPTGEVHNDALVGVVKGGNLLNACSNEREQPLGKAILDDLPAHVSAIAGC